MAWFGVKMGSLGRCVLGRGGAEGVGGVVSALAQCVKAGVLAVRRVPKDDLK